jgi:hypothetical protein
MGEMAESWAPVLRINRYRLPDTVIRNESLNRPVMTAIKTDDEFLLCEHGLAENERQ